MEDTIKLYKGVTIKSINEKLKLPSYFTTSKSEAINYAKLRAMTTKSKPIVVMLESSPFDINTKLYIPKSKINKFVMSHITGQKYRTGDYYKVSKIKPTKVKLIRVDTKVFKV